MIEVHVIEEEGIKKLVIESEEGRKEIVSSRGPITRAYSPKKKRILALLTQDRKAILYNIESDKIVLEIPLEKIHSLEYARSDDGSKVAIAAAYVEGNRIISKLYVIEGDKIVREESYDYPISIERKENELLIEKASRSFYPLRIKVAWRRGRRR